MSADMELFREPALLYRSSGQRGCVLLDKITWPGWASGLVLALVCLLLLIFSRTPYQQSQTVRGSLQPVGGTQQVVAPAAALVTRLLVGLGDTVTEGQVLAILSSPLMDSSGKAASISEIGHLQRTRDSLQREQALRQRLHRQQLAQKQRDLAALQSALGLAQQEQDLLAEEYAVSERTLGALKELLANRNLPRIEYDRYYMGHLALGRQYRQSEQHTRSLRESLVRERSSSTAAPVDMDLARSAAEREIMQLERQLDALRNSQSLSIVAQRDGQVAAVSVEPGDAVGPGTALFQINPQAYRLQAVMLMPSRLAAGLATGQRLRLAYDAFHHLQYGRYQATITAIDDAPLPPGGPWQSAGSPGEPLIKVVASLQRTEVAGPARHRLRPGYGFSAEIVQARQSLLGYLFRPLLQLAGSRP